MKDDLRSRVHYSNCSKFVLYNLGTIFRNTSNGRIPWFCHHGVNSYSASHKENTAAQWRETHYGMSHSTCLISISAFSKWVKSKPLLFPKHRTCDIWSSLQELHSNISSHPRNRLGGDHELNKQRRANSIIASGATAIM